MRPSKWLPWMLILLGAVSLTGCGNFFQPVGSGSGGSGGGSGTASGYFYVGNASSTTLAGFGVDSSSGALTAVSNSPYTSQVNITSIAVNPANTLLYAGGSGYIYVYSISSAGALTLGNSNNPVVTGTAPGSMKVDSTGNWLIMADQANLQVVVYPINTSTGTLNQPVSTLALDTGTPSNVLITHSNAYVYISLGTGGVDIFSFNASTGVLTKAGTLAPLASLNGDFGMASDSNSQYLFLTETNSKGLRVFSIGNNGALNSLSGSPYTTGNGPIAVTVDPTNSYVYVVNRTDSTISGFSLATTGALTALSGSPYATGGSPIDLVFDKSKTFLAVACSAGNGNPDLQTFKLDSTTAGKLDSAGKISTGTSNAAGNPVSLGATRY